MKLFNCRFWARTCTLFVTALLFTVSSYAALKEIAPTESQSRTIIEIIDRLAVMHYRDQKLNDELSSVLLEQYIDKLDPSKSYFLASDIKEFSQWTTLLDDMLKQGDLSAGFAIYNRYRERAINRWETNLALLESDFHFDFSLEESITLDTDTRSWPENTKSSDDYWRKRIKDSLLRLLINDKEPAAARELLIKRYKNLLSQLEQRDSEDVFQFYANAFTMLYDPHTSYYSPRSMENFNIAISLSLEGIGAVLQHEDEHTKVVSVVPKGPADKQGILQPGDKITSVAQGSRELVDVVGWRLDDVVKLIRGPKGSTVRLEIIPAKGDVSSSRVISIVRDKIQLEEQAARSEIIEIPDQNNKLSRFGVIEIPSFYMDIAAYQAGDPDYKSTSRDVKRLIDELTEQGVDGIVLDLRNNGGGLLHEATMLTDLFIDSGPVVQVRHAKQRISRHQRSRNRAYYNGPLVVLINRLSASASEIFAGAIQDYQRGLVVGSQSFGKGTVQSTSPVHEGMIKLTESKFYRVSGDSTQHRGVIPDVQLPFLYSPEDVGESNEERALPWDQITSVPHRRYTSIASHAELLQQLHAHRMETDPDLLHLASELALSRQQRDRKTLSLNMQQRLNEKNLHEQKLLELENTRRKAKQLPLLESYADWRAESEPDEENSDQESKEGSTDSESDPILLETGNIFVDYLRLSSTEALKMVNKQDRSY